MPVSPAAPCTGSVLLIDDDDALRNALTFSLESGGLNVIAFADAESALAIVAPGYACLVLDQRLPGMSGLQAMQAFRALGLQGPAIFITSHPKPELKREAERAGAAILEKPLLEDSLLLTVRSVCALNCAGAHQ